MASVVRESASSACGMTLSEVQSASLPGTFDDSAVAVRIEDLDGACLYQNPSATRAGSVKTEPLCCEVVDHENRVVALMTMG